MLARSFSGAVNGIDARIVEIEVNLSPHGRTPPGMESAVSIVGLPDTAVKESRDRVFSAFSSSNIVPPRGTLVVNLAPAGVRKEGAAFDLGSWSSLCARLEPGADGNRGRGRRLTLDASGNLVISDDDHLVGAIGVKNMAIIHTADATLVCPLDCDQRIKELLGRLAETSDGEKFM